MSYCPECGKKADGVADFCINCGTSLKTGSKSPRRKISTSSSSLADLGSRIVAGLIDFTIIIIIAFILYSLTFASRFMFGMPWGGPMLGFGWGWYGGMFGIQFLLWVIYFTYFEGTSGQTIGKKITNIRVVKGDGSACDFGSALLRNILRIVDHLPFLYLLGIVLIAATERRQRLGDMLANTILIKE